MKIFSGCFQVTDMTNGNKKPSKWRSKVRQNRCHIVAEVSITPASSQLIIISTFQAKLSQFKLSFDRTATYVFPLLFLAFNVFYWAVYLLIMPVFIQVDRDRQT